MRLKSFHGATMAEAMRQVREALGEDAIIVATRDDEMGGVRVTAAMDEAQPQPRPETVFPPPRPEIDVVTAIADALHYHGVHAALAEKLLATATHFADDDPLIALAAGFDAHVPFKPLTLDKPEQPIVLVGPPGAGKTLAVAKLATMAKLQKKPVTVITTDLVRAGGIEQMAAFTRLLKVPLLEIEQPESVADTMAELAGKGLVLVDTPGRNPYDETERQEFARMTGKTPCAIALALPCGLDSTEGSDLARAFSSLGADRLVLTRGDMTRRFGSMLNIAEDSGLALANLNLSGNVAVPLQPLNPITLARSLMAPSALLQEVRPMPPSTGTHGR